MTDIHHDYLLWELVSKEGVSEEHLANHIDEVDTVRQQHLKKAKLIKLIKLRMLIKAWINMKPEDPIHRGCPWSRHSSRRGRTRPTSWPLFWAQTGGDSPWYSSPDMVKITTLVEIITLVKIITFVRKIQRWIKKWRQSEWKLLRLRAFFFLWGN